MKDTRIKRDSAALLIIDIQEKLVPAMYNGEDVIGVNKILIQAVQAMNIPVLYTEQYPKGLGHTVTELSQLLDGAEKFEKTLFSAYSNELAASLKNKGIQSIILTGMETHVCVFQTARDLLENDFKVFLVSDGVSSRTPNNSHNGNYLMSEMGAVVTNAEAVLFDLLEKAGTDEFKVVSKLIK